MTPKEQARRALLAQMDPGLSPDVVALLLRVMEAEEQRIKRGWLGVLKVHRDTPEPALDDMGKLQAENARLRHRDQALTGLIDSIHDSLAVMARGRG